MKVNEWVERAQGIFSESRRIAFKLEWTAGAPAVDGLSRGRQLNRLPSIVKTMYTARRLGEAPGRAAFLQREEGRCSKVWLGGASA